MGFQTADEYDSMEEELEEDDGDEALELAESLCVKMSGFGRSPISDLDIRKFYSFFANAIGVSPPLIQIPEPEEDTVLVRMKSIEERNNLMRKYRSLKGNKQGYKWSRSKIILQLEDNEDPRNYTGKPLEQLQLSEALDALYPDRHMPYHKQLARKEAFAQYVIKMLFEVTLLQKSHNLKPNPMVPAYPLQGYDYDVFISLEEDAASGKVIAGIRAYALGKCRIVPLDMCHNVPQQVAIISKHFIEHLPEIGLKPIDPQTAKGDIIGLAFRMNQYGKCILAIGLPKLAKNWIPIIEKNGQLVKGKTLRVELQNYCSDLTRRSEEIRRKLEGYFTKHGTQLGIESIFVRYLALNSVYKREDKGLKNIHILGKVHSCDVYNGFTYRMFGEKDHMAECFRSLMAVIEANTLLGPSTEVFLVSQYIIAGLYLAKKCGRLTMCHSWRGSNEEDEVHAWLKSSGVHIAPCTKPSTDIKDSIVIIWNSHRPKLIQHFIDIGLRNFIYISYWDASKKLKIIKHSRVLAIVNNRCRLQGIYAVDSKPNSYTFALAAFYTFNESPVGRPLGPPPEYALLQGKGGGADENIYVLPRHTAKGKKWRDYFKNRLKKLRRARAKRKRKQQSKIQTQNIPLTAESTAPQVKTTAPPAKTTPLSTNSSAPPAKTAAPPPKITAPPPKVTAPPPKITAPPAKTTVAPTKSSARPAKITAPPAKTTVAPTKSSARPAKITAPPAKTTVASAKSSVHRGPPSRALSISQRRPKPTALQVQRFASGVMKNLKVVNQQMQELFPLNETPRELPPWSAKRRLDDHDDFTVTEADQWVNCSPGTDYTERFGKRLIVDHSDARGSGQRVSHWNSDEQHSGFGKRYDDPLSSLPSHLGNDSGDHAKGFICNLLTRFGSGLGERSSIFGDDLTDRPATFNELRASVVIGMSDRPTTSFGDLRSGRSSGLGDRPAASSDLRSTFGSGHSGRATHFGDLRAQSDGVFGDQSCGYSRSVGDRNPRYGADLGDQRDSLGSGIVDRSVGFGKDQGRLERYPDGDLRDSLSRDIGKSSSFYDRGSGVAVRSGSFGSGFGDQGASYGSGPVDRSELYGRGRGDRDVSYGTGIDDRSPGLGRGLDDRRPSLGRGLDYRSAGYGSGFGEQVRGGDYGRGLSDRVSGLDGRSDIYGSCFVDRVVDRDRTCDRSFDDGAVGYGSSLGRDGNYDRGLGDRVSSPVDRDGVYGTGLSDRVSGLGGRSGVYGTGFVDRDRTCGRSFDDGAVGCGNSLGRDGNYERGLGVRVSSPVDRDGVYGRGLSDRVSGLDGRSGVYGTGFVDRDRTCGRSFDDGAVGYGNSLGRDGNYDRGLSDRVSSPVDRDGVYGRGLSDRVSGLDGRSGVYGTGLVDRVVDRDRTCGRSFDDGNACDGRGLGDRVSNLDTRGDYGFVDRVDDRDRGDIHGNDYGRDLYDRGGNYDIQERGYSYGKGPDDRDGGYSGGLGDRGGIYDSGLRDIGGYHDIDGERGKGPEDRDGSYGTSLGDRNCNYGTGLGSRGGNYGCGLEDRGGNYGSDLEGRGVSYGRRHGDGNPRYSHGSDDRSTNRSEVTSRVRWHRGRSSRKARRYN